MSVEAVPGRDESELIRLAAGLEKASEHPLAAAIAGAAIERGLDIPAAESFQSRTGQGVEGRVDGRAVAVGNAAFLDELGRGADGPQPSAPRPCGARARRSSSC